MRKITSFFVLVSFVLSCIIPPHGFAQSLSAVGLMPQPGTMVTLTPAYTPAHLWGMTIHPNAPFKFDFLVQRGDAGLTEDRKHVEYARLIKYFLAALAVPDADQWVNLSPYEKDRIIPDTFGLTEMGRDLLAQDYFLKQLAASLTSPDTRLGKKFWDDVYAEAYKRFGTASVPTDIFNKVWIMPDKAVVFEKANTVYVLESHLKVMTEKDYLALKNSVAGAVPADAEAVTDISSQVMKDVIIPAIEKEVNEGQSFAPLRQVYSGVLLATWYKRALKGSILGRLYADKSKVKGVDQQDPQANLEIYDRYVQAFQKGVFNMIREDVDSQTQEVIPRKYFSGGTALGNTPIDYAQDGPAAVRRISQEASGADLVEINFTTAATAGLPSVYKKIMSGLSQAMEKGRAKLLIALILAGLGVHFDSKTAEAQIAQLGNTVQKISHASGDIGRMNTAKKVTRLKLKNGSQINRGDWLELDVDGVKVIGTVLDLREGKDIRAIYVDGVNGGLFTISEDDKFRRARSSDSALHLDMAMKTKDLMWAILVVAGVCALEFSSPDVSRVTRDSLFAVEVRVKEFMMYFEGTGYSGVRVGEVFPVNGIETTVEQVIPIDERSGDRVLTKDKNGNGYWFQMFPDRAMENLREKAEKKLAALAAKGMDLRAELVMGMTYPVREPVPADEERALIGRYKLKADAFYQKELEKQGVPADVRNLFDVVYVGLKQDNYVRLYFQLVVKPDPQNRSYGKAAFPRLQGRWAALKAEKIPDDLLAPDEIVLDAKERSRISAQRLFNHYKDRLWMLNSFIAQLRYELGASAAFHYSALDKSGLDHIVTIEKQDKSFEDVISLVEERIKAIEGAMEALGRQIGGLAAMATPKTFKVPSNWNVAPDKIVYDEGTDPTRKKLPTQYAVSMVLMNEEGKVFFAKRNPSLDGVWSLPSSDIDMEDDPNMLAPLKAKVAKYLGVTIDDVQLIGKRMGHRVDPDGKEWQLLMHVVFVRSYRGEPYQTGFKHETGMPKYTEMGFFSPEGFLTGAGGLFDLKTAGDCTKCFGTVLYGGYKEFESAYNLGKVRHEERPDNLDGAQLKNTGGIDFAASSLDMQIKRDGAGMPLPAGQQELDNICIDGLVP